MGLGNLLKKVDAKRELASKTKERVCVWCQKVQGLHVTVANPSSPFVTKSIASWIKGGEWDA